ncbi:MAG: GTP-binding protein [Eubacteriales bacterium]|nr:GTP-binding protein [Eubacteriales bacterium]
MTQIDLVTGFLGAGKTTFIRRYCDYLRRQGQRFAVIENEFGEAGVDTALLKEEFSDVTELAGGCICCAMKVNFHDAILEAADRCDYVVVEPSGIFNMDDFFDVTDSPDVAQRCRMGMCVAVVDPHTLPRLNADERMILAGELSQAGRVIWSKTDLEPACDLAEAARLLSDVLGTIEVRADMDALLYPVPLLELDDNDMETLRRTGPVKRDHIRMMGDHSTLFQSATFYPQGVYTQQELRGVLDAVMDGGACGDVLRVKGFVPAAQGSLAVNYTLTDRLVAPCGAQPTMLNFIGQKMRRRCIQQLLSP